MESNYLKVVAEKNLNKSEKFLNLIKILEFVIKLVN